MASEVAAQLTTDLVWFALRHVLGLPDVAVYSGSWVEWGKLPGMPIETS